MAAFSNGAIVNSTRPSASSIRGTTTSTLAAAYAVGKPKDVGGRNADVVVHEGDRVSRDVADSEGYRRSIAGLPAIGATPAVFNTRSCGSSPMFTTKPDAPSP